MQNITAVDWLINELPTIDWSDPWNRDKLSQAKAMEKKQIEDAYIMGSYDMADKKFNPSEYYNEIYERKPNL